MGRVDTEGQDLKCREPAEIESTRQEEYISAWELRLKGVPSSASPLCLDYLVLGSGSGDPVTKGLY